MSWFALVNEAREAFRVRMVLSTLRPEELWLEVESVVTRVVAMCLMIGGGLTLAGCAGETEIVYVYVPVPMDVGGAHAPNYAPPNYLRILIATSYGDGSTLFKFLIPTLWFP